MIIIIVIKYIFFVIITLFSDAIYGKLENGESRRVI